MKVSGSEIDLDLDNSTNGDPVLIPKQQSVYINLPVFGGKSEITVLRLEDNRYYLPAARGGIMQSHRIIASSLVRHATRTRIGRSSEFPTMSGVIADFMEKIILYEEGKYSNDEMKHLTEALETEVLGGQIRLKPSLSGYQGFYYRPHSIEEDIPLSQTSSMVSELAPLVLLLQSGIKSGDTLIIDEPEAHLHPGAQADMAVILARLVRAGVKVIVTTHSDWLLQEIGNLVLEGLLEDETDEPASWLLPEEVGVWHFQRDEPVKEIPFKSREGLSPEDYEDVAEGLYNRSVNLQQRLEKRKVKMNVNLHEALEEIRQWVGDKKATSPYTKEGCRVSMANVPTERVVLDVDLAFPTDRAKTNQCDFVLFYIDTAQSGLIGVPMELKRGDVDASEAVAQLQEGARIVDSCTPKDVEMNLVLVLVHGGSMHKT